MARLVVSADTAHFHQPHKTGSVPAWCQREQAQCPAGEDAAVAQASPLQPGRGPQRVPCPPRPGPQGVRRGGSRSGWSRQHRRGWSTGALRQLPAAAVTDARAHGLRAAPGATPPSEGSLQAAHRPACALQPRRAPHRLPTPSPSPPDPGCQGRVESNPPGCPEGRGVGWAVDSHRLGTLPPASASQLCNGACPHPSMAGRPPCRDLEAAQGSFSQ